MKTLKFLLLLISVFLLSFLFFQCDDVIEEVNLNEHSVTLLAPADSVVLAPGKIHFNWVNLNPNNDSIAPLYYHLQIATPDFKKTLQIMYDTILKNKTIFSDSLNASGNYEWRVKAFYNTTTSTDYTTHTLTIE